MGKMTAENLEDFKMSVKTACQIIIPVIILSIAYGEMRYTVNKLQDKSIEIIETQDEDRDTFRKHVSYTYKLHQTDPVILEKMKNLVNDAEKRDRAIERIEERQLRQTREIKDELRKGFEGLKK